MDFKSREKVIQIGAGISNRSKEIPNRGKIDYKPGLQIGAEQVSTYICLLGELLKTIS